MGQGHARAKGDRPPAGEEVSSLSKQPTHGGLVRGRCICSLSLPIRPGVPRTGEVRGRAASLLRSRAHCRA